MFPGTPATIYGSVLCIFKQHLILNISSLVYSIAQEICTRFLLCCALLWLYIDWFSHTHQAYFTDTVASKATLMNMDKYFMWIHYERLHNHNKAKYNKTVCIFLGIYCTSSVGDVIPPVASQSWRLIRKEFWFFKIKSQIKKSMIM